MKKISFQNLFFLSFIGFLCLWIQTSNLHAEPLQGGVSCGLDAEPLLNPFYPNLSSKEKKHLALLSPKRKDFASMRTSEKKKEFISYLTPFVYQVIFDVMEERRTLLTLSKLPKLCKSAKVRVSQLAKKYQLSLNDKKHQKINDKDLIKALLHRVNGFPPSLIMAQAALESAWGGSRFAVEANNYFGQWCFSRGCGVVPSSRPKGRHYEIQAFKSPKESISAYLLNLNHHSAYKKLRDYRNSLQKRGKYLSQPFLFVNYLEHYSQTKGYGCLVYRVIVSNNLVVKMGSFSDKSLKTTSPCHAL